MRPLHIAYVLLALLLSACAGKPHDAHWVDTLPPIYPDYVGVTVPPGIAPLDFDVEDADAVYVRVVGGRRGELTARGRYADFDIDGWHRLLADNVGDSLSVDVYARVDDKWLQYRPFGIHVSSDTLADWGLTYRRIAPGYEVYGTMGIYQRNLSNFDESPIIESTQTAGQCYNCHTSNRANPRQAVMHVRGDHGGTLIRCDSVERWLPASLEELGGSMVYPYWHPSGRYVAFSTNTTRQGFHIGGEKTIEVFDRQSDILVYDIERDCIITDSLTAHPLWSENTPVFSPDGRWIYFITCLQRSYPQEYKDQRYSLCRVGFDPEHGRLGATVDTLVSAEATGRSVTWPRPSYDGKHLMFTRLDCGYFSIWHPEADQWLLDLATGEMRPLDTLNSPQADSFHNWSSDGRWVVFTSRRDDGNYSRLYLAHIDSDGVASRPFMLPQRDPRAYYTQSLQSYNTPDFVAAPARRLNPRAVLDR